MANWEQINDVQLIITDANSIQHIFSYQHQATLWHAILAFKELQTAWEAKLTNPQYTLYKDAIQQGLRKIGKYYDKFDDKPVYALALGKLIVLCSHAYTQYLY